MNSVNAPIAAGLSAWAASAFISVAPLQRPLSRIDLAITFLAPAARRSARKPASRLDSVLWPLRGKPLNILECPNLVYAPVVAGLSAWAASAFISVASLQDRFRAATSEPAVLLLHAARHASRPRGLISVLWQLRGKPIKILDHHQPS